MSKKDYQALATAFYGTKPAPHTVMGHEERIAPAQWRFDVESVADALQADSGRFDRARFIEACETGTTRGMRKVSA